MLLDHTSGFANLRVLEPGRKTQIHFEPGTRYAYSGQGLQLLQLVVETVTRRPVEDLMRERIFRPFGMTRTSMLWQDRFETDYANGYAEDGHSLCPERRSSAGVAGSMQTTLGDFTRFMNAVMHRQRLRKETYGLMLSPQIRINSKHEFPSLAPETTDDNDAIHLSYGLGWGLYWTPRGQAFFKEGHDEGWRHYTVMFPAHGLGIVIMTNSSNGEGIAAGRATTQFESARAASRCSEPVASVRCSGTRRPSLTPCGRRATRPRPRHLQSSKGRVSENYSTCAARLKQRWARRPSGRG
jgi:CubicO group peptidase (beta-lactamase class C family)